MATVRRSSCALFVAPLAILAVAACGGSSDDPSLFGSPTPEAGIDPSFDSGTFAPSEPDSGPAPLGNCAPTSTAQFQPTWRPPVGTHTGACTAQQMSDLYDACLTPPIDPATCDAFKKANAACSSCVQSEEKDATLGPVIWHDNDAFFTLNIAGCIADETGDSSTQGCAAAYQAVLECKETACQSCFDDPNSTFARFSACEQLAGTSCSAFTTKMHDACGDLHDAAAPASICIPPSSTSTREVYKVLAPIFCGK